jgi:CheY-like chemotaxis protein
MSRVYRILFFDDDEEYLSLVEKGAVGNPDQPIDWITASTEDEVKEKLITNAGDIDLILIDYKLPRRSGVEFLESLRREGNVLPSVLISQLDEKSLLSDLADKHKTEIFSLHIIGFLQKPSNIIDGYSQFVEDIIEYDRRNKKVLLNTSMQFMGNADSFLADIRLDVATISRALSMLVVHFRKSKVLRRHPQLATLVSAIEEIEDNLWEVASKLADAWRTLRDIAISGFRMVPRESSSFSAPDAAVKLAREDKRRIRSLLMGRETTSAHDQLLPHITRALDRKRDATERTEMLRDLVIGIAQIDDDFQTTMLGSASEENQRSHGILLFNVEKLLSERGEERLALIVKIIRLKHLKRCGAKREFAFSLDSAFKSSLELPDNFLKREVLSTLQGLVDYEPRQ